ncbi:MAG TPA: hypothetical protein VEF76_09930 [Patescibacteria group bacterium]|nr:hypothetical protein [Patescibacteria group bacterium]
MTTDYDAHSKIRRLKTSLESVESAGKTNARDIKKLREEFDAIRRDQQQIIDNQQKQTAAIERLADMLERMNSDLYPRIGDTKKALKHPSPGK